MPTTRRPCLALLVALLMVGAAQAPAEAHSPPERPQPIVATGPAGPAPWREPTSLDEAVARLAAARERLAVTGRVPLRYTEDQLRAMARASTPGNARWLVRFAARAPERTAMLGVPRGFGKLPLWVSTFEQLEAADTDPEVIARLLGLKLDPKADYHLIVLRDLGADVSRRPEVICPTRDRLQALAERDLVTDAFGPADYNEVLAKPYRIPYHMLMGAFYAAGYREYIPDDIEAFIARTPALQGDAAAEKRFRARIRLHAQFGASEWFRGNGCTFMTGGGKRELGVNEVFVLDPEPKPIGAYADAGRLAAVRCLPLEKPGPLVFVEPE